jgi:hypothetical protein
VKCGFDIVVRNDFRVAQDDVDTVRKEFLVLGQSIVEGGRKRERIDEFTRIGRIMKMFDDEDAELMEHVCESVNSGIGWEISGHGEAVVFAHDLISEFGELKGIVDN